MMIHMARIQTRTVYSLLCCGWVCSTLLLAGCASQDTKALAEKNQALEQQLATANGEILQLKQTQNDLRDTIGQLRDTANVLTTEKTSRVEESSSLRSQVRKFIQDNIDNLKIFMVQGNILDYVGSELVPRAKLDKIPNFIVDFANAMPSDGVLTGVGGHFVQPGTFIVKVLHPVEGQYVVTWESKPLEIKESGKQQVQFPVSVGVEKGDVIGYYFSTAPNVGFDTSTGNTLYLEVDVALGNTVNETRMYGASEKRAYSLGVYGMLDSNTK
jgi:outer membrane murein-binding lipoprotein Lpp